MKDATTQLALRQQRVHAAIQRVGGYWRPLAGVVRLLEELGEVSELLDTVSLTEPKGTALAEELADIWIITTCTANQFNIKLTYDVPDKDPRQTVHTVFPDAVSHAGKVGRIINYYDGPKNPRTFDSAPTLFDAWPTLSPTIARLHIDLYHLAQLYALDLDKAIDSKLASMVSLDRGRYPQTFDPSTADSLASFNSVRKRTACPYAMNASLWGAPHWNSQWSTERNAEVILPFLLIFTKAAPHERLDGFVIAIDDLLLQTDMCVLSAWFRGLLLALADRDPKPSSLKEDNVLRSGWQFTYNSVRLFVAVFSPLYGPNHSRHSAKGTYVVLQPETSFDWNNIGSHFLESEGKKKEIRRRFAEKNVVYPADLIAQRLEAALYLLPRWSDDRCVRWWEQLGV